MAEFVLEDVVIQQLLDAALNEWKLQQLVDGRAFRPILFEQGFHKEAHILAKVIRQVGICSVDDLLRQTGQ